MATDHTANPLPIAAEATRQVVRAYHAAYCRRDVPVAAALLGDRFRFSSPMMSFSNPQQHVASLSSFVPFITGCDLISELYGEGEATLVYDLHVSLPPATQRCAEYFRVADGRICEITLIFDATPWHPIIDAAAAQRGALEGASHAAAVRSETQQ